MPAMGYAIDTSSNKRKSSNSLLDTHSGTKKRSRVLLAKDDEENEASIQIKQDSGKLAFDIGNLAWFLHQLAIKYV